MSITSIDRYFVGAPNIVGIITTDNLATITTPGYITTQLPIINLLINGDFEWILTDLVIIYYSPGNIGFFTHDITNDCFKLLNEAGEVSSITGTAFQVLVNGTSGTPVAGSVTLTLPQNIAPTSSPTFLALTAGNFNISANLLVTTNTNGSASIIPNGTGSVIIGSTTQLLDEDGFAPIFQIQDSGLATLQVSGFTNAVGGAGSIQTMHSRNTTPGGHTILQNGDVLGDYSFYGDDGVGYILGAQLISNVDGTPSSGIMPANLRLQTKNSSGTLVTGMTISSSQITTLANPLPVGSGGLGVTTTPTNGQIPIGNGSNYTIATITPGTGISVTNGIGTITLATTGSSPWTDQTTSSVSMVANSGYTADAGASLITFTLPTTAAVGDWSEINGFGSGLWTIAQAAGQRILWGPFPTTIGAGGSISSVLASDCIRIRCVVANTTWVVVSAQGNLVVV